ARPGQASHAAGRHDSAALPKRWPCHRTPKCFARKGRHISSQPLRMMGVNQPPPRPVLAPTLYLEASMETGVFVMIVFVSLGSLAMIATIVWLGVHSKNRKATLQAEVQTRLIDKFSNAPEFVDFLNSDTGKQFLTGIDKMPQLMARDRIVGGVSRGVIMMLLGAAFIAI